MSNEQELTTDRERVRGLVAGIAFTDDFTDDAPLLGLIDSLGMMEVVAFIEAELGVRVRRRDIHPAVIGSVSAILRFVAQRRAETASPVSGTLSRQGETT